MKRSLPLRALAFLLLLTPRAAAQQPVDVVFVGGQSNAKPELADGVRAVLGADGRFENLRVVNKRHGGTPIRFWLDEGLPPDHRRSPARQKQAAPNWYQVDFMKAPGVRAPAAFLEKVFEEERAAGRAPRLAGLVWFHGESDSENDAQVAAYRDRLDDLRRRVSRDFAGGEAVPTVLVQVAVNEDFVPTSFGPRDPERVGRIDALRKIQAALAEEDATVAVVDSRPFERVDVWHVDWESEPVPPMQKLGEACGRALLGLHGP